MSCDFNKLYEGDFSQIKLCYNDLKLPAIRVQNPLNRTDSQESCFLLSDKKVAYYNITYDPEQILKQIKEYNTDEKIKIEYLDKLQQIMITDPKLNCCNCVSFIYYAIDNDIDIDIDDEESKQYIETDYIDVLKKIYGYMSSLRLSVINIKNKLLNFIARIYLDISLFKIIANAQIYDTGLISEIITKIKDTITFLFTSDNVEIYTYLCKSYSNQRNITQLRCQRFLTLIDPEVACSIIREADGYITYLDCFNIQNFVDSKKIMFMYNILNVNNALNINLLNNLDETIKNFKGDNRQKPSLYYQPYSEWLQYYQKSDEYYKTHYTLFDILAGTFGMNIQIKSDKFYEIFNLLSKKMLNFDKEENEIKELADKHYKLHGEIFDIKKKIKESTDKSSDTETNQELREKLIKLEIEFEPIKHINSFTSSTIRNRNNILHSGFDEIFLMTLFRDLYTLENNMKELDELKNIQFYMSNIFVVRKVYTIYINNSDYENIIDPFDFLKDEININPEKMIQMLRNMFGVIIKKDVGTNILGAYHRIRQELKQKKMLKNMSPDTYYRLLLTTFDLCIDNEHFKKVDYAIDFNLIDFEHKLSSNLNYMFTKDCVDNLYFDIYENKYGNFYDINHEQLSGGYKHKYLKYKHKYLQLKNKN